MSTEQNLTDPYDKAREAFIQALTDDQPMVDEDGRYREYVEDVARETVDTEAGSFFIGVLSHADWVENNRADAKERAGQGER